MEHGTTARPPLRGFRITSNEWCRRYIPSQKVVRCLHFHQLTFRIGFVLKCGSVEHERQEEFRRRLPIASSPPLGPSPTRQSRSDGVKATESFGETMGRFDLVVIQDVNGRLP